MKAKNIPKSPDLPPEIIDIIVREIASQDLKREALKACSRVSKSFCSSSRPHLFSDIELVSNKFSQSRAARLVQIFQNPDNVGLAACVRSLTLIFDVPQSSVGRAGSFPGSRTLDRRIYKSKMTALALAGRLNRYENEFIQALNLLVQAPLESFTLHAQRGVPGWEMETKEAREKKKAILLACIAPLTTLRTLHTLRLSDLVDIDESLIARVIHSSTLKELALRHVTLRLCDDPGQSLDLHPVTSQIKRLELRHLSYMQVLRVSGRSTSPAIPLPYPFITFSHLHHLIISGPWPNHEAHILQHFMLGLADTLESLEIQEIRWEDMNPILLGELTSLRRLKIISSTRGDPSGAFAQKLRLICRLLSTTALSPPSGIQSLTIQFNVQMSPETDFRHAQLIRRWFELDDILTDSYRSFSDLRQVDLDFHFFFLASSPAPTGWQPPVDIYVLPRLSSHPSIKFHLNFRNICTPYSMAAHLHFTL